MDREECEQFDCSFEEDTCDCVGCECFEFCEEDSQDEDYIPSECCSECEQEEFIRLAQEHETLREKYDEVADAFSTTMDILECVVENAEHVYLE